MGIMSMDSITGGTADIQFVKSRRFGIQATVPSLKTSAPSKAKACYDKSFHVKAAQLWNLLPATTKDFDSLDKFKISLYTVQNSLYIQV